jgi:UDP:flavonoid glycosyltransferase YjiC (YdhE family)
MSQQKILIYAINGKGMGHLNRTLVLARAAREHAPAIDILFAVASQLFWLVRDAGFPVLKVADRNHALGYHVGLESRPLHLAATFEPILDQYRPSSLVVDMTLNKHLFDVAARYGANVALMLRKQRTTALAKATRDPAIKRVDRFLVPHPTDEFTLDEIPAQWRHRVRRLGPVVKTLQLDRVPQVKARYSSSGLPLVVVTIGGGGNKEAEATLTAADQAAAASVGEIDWVMVYGPYYPGSVPPSHANVRRVRFEADMLELCTAADVVICNAGYNTIREVTVAGTPAIVIPLDWSGADDQMERAQLLAQNGRAVIGQTSGPGLLAQVRELVRTGAAMRRPPTPGEPAAKLGERFVEALR